MESKFKKLIFSILAVLIIYNFWKAYNPTVEIDVDEEAKPDPKTTLVVKEKALVVEEKIEEKKPAEEKKLEKAYENYLKVYLPKAQRRDIKCSTEADELFKDPSFIDIEDPFYKNPMNVIEGLHDVYTKTLVRVEVVDAYVALASILSNDLYQGTKLTPGEYRNQISLLEYYCRPEISLRFIETVMEANKRYNFSPKMKKDIFDMSISMLDSVVGEMYTTNNLIYGLGFFKLLIDNAMLPKEVGEELVPIFDKVLEHHKGFTNTWQRDKEANDKATLWSLLKEDQTRRTELGSEFKEFVGRIKTQYHSR